MAGHARAGRFAFARAARNVGGRDCTPVGRARGAGEPGKARGDRGIRCGIADRGREMQALYARAVESPLRARDARPHTRIGESSSTSGIRAPDWHAGGRAAAAAGIEKARAIADSIRFRAIGRQRNLPAGMPGDRPARAAMRCAGAARGGAGAHAKVRSAAILTFCGICAAR